MSVTYPSETVQGDIAVVPADSRRLMRAFVELPYSMYAADRHWVPPLRRDEHRRLSRRNPFWAHAEMQAWVAVGRGGVRGRIAAIEDRAHNDFHRERVTWFGFFEAADRATASVLLAQVHAWARRHGSHVVRGPVNPSLNESGGLLIHGFDDDPYVMMPYNPPDYAEFIESNGYEKAKDLLAWEMDLTVPLGTRVQRVAERIRRRRDVVVRPVDMKAFDRDLALMNDVYRSAWERNWGFVPPTDAEMRQLATDLKPVIDPDLVLFAEMAGRTVGCVVVLPDVNQVLRRMNGRLLPFGVWHFLNRRRVIRRVRLVLLGVLAEYRNLGLYPLLIAEIHRRAVAGGYLHGEMSWTLEDNESVNAGIVASGGVVSKRYRLYEKRVG